MEQHSAAVETTLRAELGDEFQAAFDRDAAMSAIDAATFITEVDTAAFE